MARLGINEGPERFGLGQIIILGGVSKVKAPLVTDNLYLANIF